MTPVPLQTDFSIKKMEIVEGLGQLILPLSASIYFFIRGGTPTLMGCREDQMRQCG